MRDTIFSDYQFILEDEFMGTPCKIGVISIHITKPWSGNPYLCLSDYDFYGGTEIEWELLKWDGKTSFDWLEKRLTRDDRIGIEDRIKDVYEQMNEPDYYDREDCE